MTESEQRKERYEWYKAHGICVKCGQEKAKAGRVSCWRCLANTNDSSKIYHSQELYTEEKKKSHIKSEENLINKRNEQGLCWKCGKRPPVGKSKYSQCEVCNKRAAELRKEKRLQKGVTPRFMFGNGEFCSYCGKPVENKGDKTCYSCHERATQWADDMRKRIDYKNHIWRKGNEILFVT